MFTEGGSLETGEKRTPARKNISNNQALHVALVMNWHYLS